jgi:hypothetical protein
MSNYRLRQSYGHGAARVTLAPSFTPSPYSKLDTLATNLDVALHEIHAQGGFVRLVRRVVLGGGGSIAAAVALSLLLAPLFRQPPDDPGPQIVMVTPPTEEPGPLLPPEPEPVLPEPEPEPVEIAQEPEPLPEPVIPEPEPKPEPVKVVKKAPPPPPPLPAMPAPAPPPKEFVPTPAPVRVAREPVKKPPAVVSIDPLAPVPTLPSEEPAPPPKVARTAPRAPAPKQPVLPALADFTPIGDPAPSGAPVSVASRAVRTNVVARNNAPSRPPAFAAAAPAAPPASFDENASAPAFATRNAQQRPKLTPTTTSSRPSSLGFSSATPAAVTDTTAASVGRTERAAPQRSGSGSAQNENLAAVPLGSLAACATDREEDERKMALLGVVRGRTECSSAAGRYRFVETKNLNAFLMWIERAPNRPAVDRCVELRLALECLGG